MDSSFLMVKIALRIGKSIYLFVSRVYSFISPVSLLRLQLLIYKQWSAYPFCPFTSLRRRNGDVITATNFSVLAFSYSRVSTFINKGY